MQWTETDNLTIIVSGNEINDLQINELFSIQKKKLESFLFYFYFFKITNHSIRRKKLNITQTNITIDECRVNY